MDPAINKDPPALSVKPENTLGKSCCTGHLCVPRLAGTESTVVGVVGVIVSLSSHFIKPVRRLIHTALSLYMHPQHKDETKYRSQCVFHPGYKIKH